MLIFYVIYFFLILRFAITLFNFISNPKLIRSRYRSNDLISVLIPVRNEQTHIPALLNSLRSQRHTNFEVLILNDASSDNTELIIREFVRTDARFKMITGETLPEGWTGKNFACHQLARNARGSYFIFLDADTLLKDEFLSNAVQRVKANNLSLLSVFPDIKLKKIADYLVLPIIHYLLLNLVPLRLVRLSKSPFFSAASGQCMIFNADMYRGHWWHAQVKDSLAEDADIVRLMKSYHYGVETLLANGYICTERKHRFSTLTDSVSKHLLAEFNNNLPALLCYFLLVMIGPIFILSYLGPGLIFQAITLIVLARLMISLASRQNPLLNIVLHPAQMLVMIFVFIQALKGYRKGYFSWKGRRVPRT